MSIAFIIFIVILILIILYGLYILLGMRRIIKYHVSLKNAFSNLPCSYIENDKEYYLYIMKLSTNQYNILYNSFAEDSLGLCITKPTIGEAVLEMQTMLKDHNII